MPYPRFQKSRNFKFAERTAGNVPITSTTQAVIDAALDLTLAAQVGDVLEYVVQGLWQAQTVGAYLDVATMVSGSAVNRFSGGSDTTGGLPSTYAESGSYRGFLADVMYQVVSADVSGGLVTLRLMGRLESAGTKTLYASGAPTKLQVWAKNLGPADST